MEHVRCQRSLDVDLSYRFWSCSLCIKNNECTSLGVAQLQGINIDPRNIPLITIPTPENSQAGNSPIEMKHSPGDEKPSQDVREFQICGLKPPPLVEAALFHQNQFLIPTPPYTQNPILALQENLNRKFLGLPARSVGKRLESSQSDGAQEAFLRK